MIVILTGAIVTAIAVALIIGTVMFITRTRSAPAVAAPAAPPAAPNQPATTQPTQKSSGDWWHKPAEYAFYAGLALALLLGLMAAYHFREFWAPDILIGAPWWVWLLSSVVVILALWGCQHSGDGSKWASRTFAVIAFATIIAIAAFYAWFGDKTPAVVATFQNENADEILGFKTREAAAETAPKGTVIPTSVRQVNITLPPRGATYVLRDRQMRCYARAIDNEYDHTRVSYYPIVGEDGSELLRFSSSASTSIPVRVFFHFEGRGCDWTRHKLIAMGKIH